MATGSSQRENVTQIQRRKQKKEKKDDRKENVKSSEEVRKTLIEERKLILLIDLDNTIVHAKKDIFDNLREDLHHFPNRKNNAWYHLKIRPQVHRVLSELKRYYRLYVSTLANVSYAKKVMSIVDPLNILFEDTLLANKSRGLYTDKTKYIQTFLPNLENVICIIDDRKDAWKSIPNLVPVDEYIYFSEPDDVDKETWEKDGEKIYMYVKGGNKKDYIATEELIEYNETDEDGGYFMSLRNYLIEIHREFYNNYDKNGTIDIVRAITKVKRNF